METTQRILIELERLSEYDVLIKQYIADADATIDAKSIKTVAFDPETNTISFYKKEEPIGETDVADYTVELPEVDFTEVYNKITEVEGKVTKNAEDISAIQTSVSELEALVGEIPEGATATTVVGYAKELADKISEEAYDDTEIRGLIQDNADAIEAHKTAIDGVVTTLVGEDTGKSVRTIANEELTKQLIPENAKESLDTLEEIATWIQAHPDDASAMNLAITNLQNLVGTIPEDATAETIVAYIQEVVAAEATRATGVETGLDTRLQAVESKLGTGEGSVDAKIEAAKTEAINSAKTYTDEQIEAIDLSGIETNADAIEEIQTSLAEGGATANAIADAKKAGTDAADAVTALENGQVKTNTDDIAELKENMDAFTFATTEQIQALFA